MSPGRIAAMGTVTISPSPTNLVAVSVFSAARLPATARVFLRMF
jgi:hypothetical protein